MSLFFLSYDLNNNKNYQKLYTELERLNAVRIIDSTWCFNRFNITAKDLRDHFKDFIDSDDSLIVSEVTAWASFNTISNPNNLK